MPLLHQDTSRGAGGSAENRRSLADFLGFDAARLQPAAAPAPNHRGNDCNSDEWRWEEPGSPEAAQTPRSLVPAACFPPRHPRAFASYSESARPGTGWGEETNGQGITDLVASLALAMPAAASPRVKTSIHMRLSYDADKNMDSPWSTELPPSGPARDEMRVLPRRASFCGVVSSGRNGTQCLSWSGPLPARCTDPSGGFSVKVFIGGLPYDISEQGLLHTFRHFQPVRVEYPGREDGSVAGPRGFAYVTFESERRVRALLAASRRDGNNWYYRVASRKMRSKEAQVIPWAVSDSNWVSGGSARLEPGRTVFVGALHGMLSASALATIMNNLFQGVVYAGIDTDKNKYPIGSGRVTFNNVRSYVRAVSAAYVEICTDKFTKKVQVDPYLEDSMCSVCNLHQGPYFCREPICFRYFCHSCWSWQHPQSQHRYLTRGSRAAAGPSKPDDPSPIYNGGLHPNNEGTPSPSTSGTSGASEFEHADDADAASWGLH
ncbi:cytoplasmic polyadenylation element-binding protein 1-A isoform X2 [Pectinophora gossypiella]|uniref:cytoplasmic polyadenylation element-binding protein 1-A isoform X2 n=1 Tax=Pectinophora gossypiella TaxID=13191 RepID=UPI00214EF128|nr:cytoplasmic polyadenylation element-binding protein 1-A isoform X2 [Pectinophora gossypiella]